MSFSIIHTYFGRTVDLHTDLREAKRYILKLFSMK